MVQAYVSLAQKGLKKIEEVPKKSERRFKLPWTQKFKNRVVLFLLRKDVKVMAVVYVTLIVKGKKTLDQVPSSLKVEVTEMLKDLEVEV